ncbi:hypothetical protein Tco_1374708 [Tanacetum coccineum]
MVNDGSATTAIICFSDQAHTLTTDVNEAVPKLSDKNPYVLPPCLQQLQGTTHIFQFHFDAMITSRRPDFVLNRIFPPVNVALPPPEPAEIPVPYITDELQQTPTEFPTVSETTQTSQQHYEKESEQLSISEGTTSTETKLPNPSVRKTLFRDPPEIQTPQATKKQRNDPTNK